MSSLAPPKARPAAATAAIVIGLVLIAVAVITVRDLAVARGWATGETWTGAAADRLDGLTADGIVVATGIGLLAVGLWAVYLAVKPARRTHHRATSDHDVWVTDHAVTGVAVRAAEDTPGVAGATARPRRSRISVSVESDRPDAQETVETNVRAALAGLSDRTVAVTTKKVSHDS